MSEKITHLKNGIYLSNNKDGSRNIFTLEGIEIQKKKLHSTTTYLKQQPLHEYIILDQIYSFKNLFQASVFYYYFNLCEST